MSSDQVTEEAALKDGEPQGAGPGPQIVGLTHLGEIALLDVPARDLTHAEISELGLDYAALLASGAYVVKYAEEKE